MASRRRLLMLVVAASGLAALGLALEAPPANAPAVAVAPRRALTSPPPAGPSAPRPRAAWAPLDATAAQAWAPAMGAPAAVTPVASRPAAAAPVTGASAPMRNAPLPPYTLIGRLEDDGLASAWLATPQRLIEVKAGDVLDQQWRVERIGPIRIELTWLPNGERRTLDYPRS